MKLFLSPARAILFSLLTVSTSFAQPPSDLPPNANLPAGAPAVRTTIPAPRATHAEKLNLDQIQQKYLGNASNEIQVVQNRKYTKAHKVEIGLMGGWVSADPFLNVTAIGGYLGYHFSEALGVRALYWKDSASKNAAWSQIQDNSGLVPNTNGPSSMIGAELQFTPMYGKVSLLGSSIIYYDLSLFAGGGERKTESGSAFSPLFGIGQQFFFSRYFAFGVDYRIMHYKETVLNSQDNASSAGSRTDYTHVLFLSLSCFLGG